MKFDTNIMVLATTTSLYFSSFLQSVIPT